MPNYSPRRSAALLSRHFWSSAVVLLALIGSSAISSARPAPQQDWQAQVRARVAEGELDAALEITERRLRDAPRDLEACGWRARLLAWTKRWTEAEAEYRRVLESAPDDTDVLLGLADVLAWQQRWPEALALLERARRLGPPRADAMVRYGRALNALGRKPEALDAFRAAMRLDPSNAEARAALELAAGDGWRHELRIGADTDVLSFTENAYAATLSLRSRWSDRWATSFAGNFHHRFGEDAGKFSGAITYRLARRASLTAGGAAARDFGVIPRGEAFFELARGFSGAQRGPFRGAELSFRQQWLWFREARVLTLTPAVLIYLPRDWTWSLAVTAARSRFPGTPAGWEPAGIMRLGIPLHRRVRAEAIFAVGTENFAQRDQLGRFSARTWGGALRFRLAPRHEVSIYSAWQDRSQNRSQISFGWSYAFRF